MPWNPLPLAQVFAAPSRYDFDHTTPALRLATWKPAQQSSAPDTHTKCCDLESEDTDLLLSLDIVYYLTLVREGKVCVARELALDTSTSLMPRDGQAKTATPGPTQLD